MLAHPRSGRNWVFDAKIKTISKIKKFFTTKIYVNNEKR